MAKEKNQPEVSLDEEIQQAEKERKKKISNFHLEMNLEDEFGEYNASEAEKTEQEEFTDISSGEKVADLDSEEKEDSKAYNQPGSFNPFSEESQDMEENNQESDPNAPVRLLDEEEEIAKPKKKVGKKEKNLTSCMGGLLYIVSILAVSCVLACIIIISVLDMLAINKSSEQVDVTIPQGASTKQIATILHENDLISHPFIFRVFSKFTHSDGSYQSGVFTLAPKDGYQGIIRSLQSMGERATVDVTVPEGLNVLQIGNLLEENGVCTSADFLKALKEGDFSDYDFVKNIPEIGSGTDHPYRIYRLEGYLFPDTYTFYQECSAETVICKFFDNFETKLDTSLKAAFKAAGLSVDEAVTLASIVQHEADNATDMTKVSRVFHNRLNDLSEYPYLQSDVTTEYAGHFIQNVSQDNETFKAYSTYDCVGLPTGPICNPGISALDAVANPCKDSDVINCYYFATDLSVEPTVTYYSETYSEHVYICTKYGIGVHG